MLANRLAFVDLETTGATATADRIIEIGIVEVDEYGMHEWSSLINPETHISDFITGLTGISDEMVTTAPTFEEIAQSLYARLENRLFIAHNARFDHGFLKNEFRRVGLDFRPTVLCTVKLSRQLFPEFGRHNLDILIERHRLEVTERHRALGDARLIWQFWQVIMASLPPEKVDAAVKQLTARPTLPVHLDATLIDDLPTGHGVYFFYGENNLPLYIGKANDLRRRVLSHFSADHRSGKEMELSQQVRRIDWIETAGEIGALLQEAYLIKRLSPVHNRRLRRNDQWCTWRLIDREDGAHLVLVKCSDLLFVQEEQLYGLYSSPDKAQKALRGIADAHALCPILLGLEKARPGKPCFASQVKRCLGVCCGMESRLQHDTRLYEALAPLRLQHWPYPGPIGIREGQSLHVVDGWGYLGTARSEEEIHDLIEHHQSGFDRDVYQILIRRLPHLASRLVPIRKQP